MSIVLLNNEFLPAEQARISPLDRGFIFGDGVYEVIPVYGGQLFMLDEHLRRLNRSLAGVRIRQPHSDTQWDELLHTLVKRNNGGDQSLYLQITRGVAARDHAFPDDNISPTVFVMCNPLSPVSDPLLQKGVVAITLEDTRWKHCNLKTIALLPNILLRQQALDNNAAEAILIRDGNVTEGAASNVFIVKDKVIITPPEGPTLLPGITRDLVLELATKNNLANKQQLITPEDLLSADEIWLTSSSKEILPVIRLDDLPVANGKPGSVWKQMILLYQQYKAQLQGK